MKSRATHWLAALAVSGLIHAAGASFLAPDADGIEIAGGGATELALLGNAFADQLSAGETDAHLDPVHPTDTTAAVEPDAARPAELSPPTAPSVEPTVSARVASATATQVPPQQPGPVESALPAPAAAAVRPAEAAPIPSPAAQPRPSGAVAAETATPSEAEAVEASEPGRPSSPEIAEPARIATVPALAPSTVESTGPLPIESPPASEAAELPAVAERTAAVEPVEPLSPPAASPAVAASLLPAAGEEPPLEPVARVEPAPSPTPAMAEAGAPDTIAALSPTERLEPAAETDPLAHFAQVPIPSPRPDYSPPRRAEPVRQAATQHSQQQPRPARTQPQAGSRGRNQADSTRGAADGSTSGQAAAAGPSRAGATQAGNAAVSNYPGQVATRLRRSLRYPATARRQNLRGEVHVSFTVDRSGGVGGVRIARSSGSPILDDAAIETVRRAAPFPPIPDSAGRSNWPFTVPLAFTR